MTRLRLFLLILLTAACLPVHGKTVYIDDTLYAPVRSGEGTQYRVLHNGVRSGTPVELLERSESGYSRVRTPDGIEGWIVSRYLTERPIAKDRLNAMEKELERARTGRSELLDSLKATEAQRDELVETKSRLEQRVESLSTELTDLKEISSDAVNLKNRNEELLDTSQKLRNDMELLLAENERLEDKSESDFMLLGAGLVTLGVILALLVPVLKPSRKNDNWA
ncbi:MAG: TIGR04211 family SH3 domain-containing protein [Oleiphilaceae bacterium]|nr:TIGR04211 family SH3 domain-containing protein [Oleiphilaceae bacterium]